MVFLGVFMVRFYYVSKVRSVPEYLKRRYDHRSHVLNAATFLVVTMLMSGINMYALAIVCQQMLGWSFNFSVLFSAGVVVTYTFLGGLSSSIYNEVLQFFLIVFGFVPLAVLGLIDVGGWHGPHGETARAATSTPGRAGRSGAESAGRRVVRAGDGAGAADGALLLVHGLPAGAARAGGQGPGRRAQNAADRGVSQDAVSCFW